MEQKENESRRPGGARGEGEGRARGRWILVALVLAWLYAGLPAGPLDLSRGDRWAAAAHLDAARRVDPGVARGTPRALRRMAGIGAGLAVRIADERFRRGGEFEPRAWSELDGIGLRTVERALTSLDGRGGERGAGVDLEPEASRVWGAELALDLRTQASSGALVPASGAPSTARGTMSGSAPRPWGPARSPRPEPFALLRPQAPAPSGATLDPE